jgi:hypothetical protein
MRLSAMPLVGLVVAVLGGVQPAHASPIVYDNGAPNSVSGNEMTQWIQAEDFTLSSTTLITGVQFWAFQTDDACCYTGSITFDIYSDASDSPGTVLESGSVTPTRTFDHSTSFGPSYVYDFAIPDFLAVGGTQYWLGLHNGPLTTQTRDEMYWETTDPTSGDGHELIAPFSGGWDDNSQEHAFNLTGTTAAVPEPASLVLLGSGLIGLAARRRRSAR